MANGFLTSSPGARHGASLASYSQACFAQKFVCGGSGAQVGVEIGLWAKKFSANSLVHLAIFDHDAVNNCPSTIVANSDSGELTINNTTVSKFLFTYITQPALTGGTTYWIAVIFGPTNITQLDINTSGGVSLEKTTGVTYSTWPTDAEWETHTDRVYDSGLYVVYQVGSITIVATPILLALSLLGTGILSVFQVASPILIAVSLNFYKAITTEIPTDWRSMKGLRPWILFLQEDKLGYVNNPEWVETQTIEHAPCGYWFKD